MTDTPSAVILSGGGWPGAYDIVRTLHRAGVRSFVASSQPDDIAFYSRSTCGKVLLPQFQVENYERILRTLQDVSIALRKRCVLYYVGDSELDFVSHFRYELQPFFSFLLPEQKLVDAFFNKTAFYSLAQTFGLPVPTTQWFANSAQVEDAVGAIDFPCIVKPPSNRDWFWQRTEDRLRLGSYKQALRRFDSKNELLEFCQALPENPSGFLIQSYIDGSENALTSFHGFFDEQSLCLGYFISREIRTNPPGTGESSYSETIYNDELARESIEHLQRLGTQGIVKVDYKWNARRNRYDILEIEPHFQFLHLLGAFAGVNLPLIAHQYLQGEHLEAKCAYKTNTRILYLRHDIAAYVNGYRKTKEWPFHTFLKSYMARKHYRIFDPKDPLPFLYSATRFVRDTITTLFRKKKKRSTKNIGVHEGLQLKRK